MSEIIPVEPPTVSSFKTINTWSAVAVGVSQIWIAMGWHLDWLGQFNAAVPHLLTVLGILGVLVDNHVSSPRKVSLPFSRHVVRLHIAASFLLVGLILGLLMIPGCLQPIGPSPIVGPPTTQQSLQAEQNTLNGISTAVDLGWDAWLFYDSTNPNPIDAALAKRAHDAVEAAIATAQSHISAGDLASTQAAMKDVQAAFQAFLTSGPVTKAKMSANKSARLLHH